jgi:hypothetical protein
MDINCTHKCLYQHEGKCGLQEVPSFSQAAYSNSGVDCPYYRVGGWAANASTMP